MLREEKDVYIERKHIYMNFKCACLLGNDMFLILLWSKLFFDNSVRKSYIMFCNVDWGNFFWAKNLITEISFLSFRKSYSFWVITVRLSNQGLTVFIVTGIESDLSRKLLYSLKLLIEIILKSNIILFIILIHYT